MCYITPDTLTCYLHCGTAHLVCVYSIVYRTPSHRPTPTSTWHARDMPSVFFSYSRNDLALIEQLQAQLKNHPEIAIWRDQDKIYGGQKWPKVLGEAIADQDVVLLAWSRHAAASHFVEFEWTTAIALKKTIVPCLLDETPLMESLREYHAHPMSDIAGIVRALCLAAPTDVARRRSVISTLNDITVIEQKVVLEQIKAVFAQQQWIVQGSIYQAGGDIHIHTAPLLQKEQQGSKPLIEKWETWAGLAAALLTIVTSLFLIQEKFADPPIRAPISSLPFSGKPEVAADQSLSGTIFGEQNRRLPGVQVKLPEFNKLATTDEEGRFEFSVKAPQGQELELIAEKLAYKTEERFASAGNPHYDFTMQRTPQ
jgi:hypothetical protein